ncbi:MAG: hypothetical protein A3I44_02825 [Candidatus Sungbacteria bacterium RIFCSPLOWO2_02_FULL_51_17]|nr:MAG: hypothetical protein A2676_00480 [Candidatus Sungbacteria bacterium RIFCSPHIGHO2_01_FULL_51_22]OHA10829.1 MAG: hypothetical protein A3I44_02825 [Candidatus Sungbacteria bacterium RIFCSPLOWO2_02_FULL_51_17]
MSHTTIRIIFVGVVIIALSIVWMGGVFRPTGSAPDAPGASSSRTISRDDALEKVRTMPEVEEYIAMLKEAGAHGAFNVEDRGDEWAVQVYEIVQQGEDSHTATFNWYRIHKSTGAALKEFE